MQRFTPTILLLSAGLALTACGQTPTADDALAPFTGQTLNWHTCDSTILGQDSSDLFATLGSRLECTDVNVPMDWSTPSRATMTIALLRVKAEHQDQKQGTIFINPGGPGGDGLPFAALYGSTWAQGDTTTALGASFKKLSEQYDLIGFSPRGVGASSRLYCGTNELQSPINYPSADRSPENIAAMVRNGRLDAEACKKNPMTPFINTDATVQDLDLTRRLIGEQKFNYIGYSYGTWLGAWYAKRFPEAAGRMLLDGNTDFSAPFQNTFQAQYGAFDRDFRRVVIPYLARLNSLFELGPNPDDIYAQYTRLSIPLKEMLSGQIPEMLYDHSNMPLIGLQLVAARGVDGLLREYPNILPANLVDQLQGKTLLANADLNAAALDMATDMLTNYDAVLHPQPVSTAPDAVFTAVTCNDSPWGDLQSALAFDQETVVKAPLMSGDFAQNACFQWGGPVVTRPALPATMPPLLMLQNEYDPATPAEGALVAWKATPNARMIFINNESQHAAFPYGTECVDLPITRYFLNGAMPSENFSTCQALPLVGEKQVYPVGKQNVALATQNAHVEAFRSAAQDDLKKLRSIISKNAIGR